MRKSLPLLVAALLWCLPAAADIVLGQSAPLSGPYAQLGNEYRAGALLAIDDANRHGGVAGQPVVLVTLDDEYNVKRALANTRELVQRHRAVALLNHMFTNTVRATAVTAGELGIAHVAPYTGHADFYAGSHPTLFMARASFDDELRAITQYISTIGLTTVGVVHNKTSVGQEFLADVRARLGQYGLQVVATASMPIGDPDGTAGAAAAATLAAAQLDAVVLGVSGADAVSFLRSYQALGARSLYFARSLVSSGQLHQELGQGARGIVVSQLVPSPFKPTLQIVRDYRRLLSARDPLALPSYVEFEGFINARLMLKALERAGSNPTAASVLDAMRRLGRVDLGGHVIDFSRGHVGSRFVDLTMMRGDGTFSQ